MNGPIELIVAAFKDENKAAEALESLRQLDRKDIIDVVNAAVLVKDQDGKASIRETADLDTKWGALLGAVAGGLIGLLGGPVGVVAGAAAGAAAGGVAAHKIDLGFDDDYLREIQASLPAGSSAIIALIEHEWVDKVIDALAAHEAQVVRRAIKEEVAAQLADTEEVAAEKVDTEEAAAE